MANLEPTIDERLATLEQLFTELQNRTDAMDTIVDATEQSLEAIKAAEKNREKIRDLRELYAGLNRKLNAIASVVTGAGLIWWGNSLGSDAISLNDRWGEWFTIVGIACISLGILALYGKEEALLNWALSLNPWRKSDG